MSYVSVVDYLKLLAYQALRTLGYKALVDPEIGRGGVVAGGPVTDGQRTAVLAMYAQVLALRKLIDEDSASAPETRHKWQTWLAQLEARIVADSWGAVATPIVTVMPDEVIQSTAARSLLDMSNRKVWAEMAQQWGLDPAAAERAYQQSGGDSRYAALLGLHGLSALETLNDRYHIPGMKSWIASATKVFADKANAPYWRARTADLADSVAALVAGVRDFKALAG